MIPNYNDISAILAYFDANAYTPEVLIEDLAQTPEATVVSMRESMEILISEDMLGMQEFKKTTACEAKSEDAARAFFREVYRFAFENGSEPDLTEHRRR